MTSVQSLWDEFGAAKMRLAQVFAEPQGLFDAMVVVPAGQEDNVIRLHDAKRKPSRKKGRKARRQRKA